MKSIKIGNAGGFWGDDLNALRRQIEGGDLDYISSDYLAEITMSILRKQQLKNPALGYVTDFVDQLVDVAEIMVNKKVRMIANAGGINPMACANEILRRLNGRIPLKIAVIEGDNIMELLSDKEMASEIDFTNMENGAFFTEIEDEVQSANAYLGIPPLLSALETGADLIIAGRVTDTSITMAPMVHEFGWQLNDWNKLSSGLIAGHIIECGAQGSGGNFTDWHLVNKWDHFGYPIVEVYEDAHFEVTKHNQTGGLISINSIKEQLLYEMGNPAEYISPDVVADFRTIRLNETKNGTVSVSGIKGRPSTKLLKVSMAYQDGYKAVGSIIISGGKALEKARAFDTLFRKRLNTNFVKMNTEFVGYNATHKSLSAKVEPNEILLRFSVYDTDKDKITHFGKSLAPLILSGPPGVAVTSGRPRAQSVMTYWPALIPKIYVKTTVTALDNLGNILSTHTVSSVTGYEEDAQKVAVKTQTSSAPSVKEQTPDKPGTQVVKWEQICLARSGDKGDMANIGVIARSSIIYGFIKEKLTVNLVKSMFADHCKGKVLRYELENLESLNFLLEESLDGGGTKSLMIDAQGKTFAQALLNQLVEVPNAVLDSLNTNKQ